jgi:hypothetical protein
MLHEKGNAHALKATNGVPKSDHAPKGDKWCEEESAHAL